MSREERSNDQLKHGRQTKEGADGGTTVVQKQKIEYKIQA
jgi:hypothetical protein